MNKHTFWDKYIFIPYDKYIRYTKFDFIPGIRTIYYNLKHGFINLWIWRKVVWRNRGWDHSFIYDVLEHQLKIQEKCIREGYNVRAEQVANDIKKTRLTLSRLKKDEYMFQEDNVFNAKNKYLKKFGDNKLFEQYMIQQDLDYVFGMMKKHIQEWWD